MIVEQNAWPYRLHPVVRSERAKGALLQPSGEDGRVVQCTDRPTSPPYVFLTSALHIQEVIARALRLSGGMYDELAISAKLGNHPAISAADFRWCGSRYQLHRQSVPADEQRESKTRFTCPECGHNA